MNELQEKVRAFRSLHQGMILVLPNAWDAGSARVVENVGAKAIATTSCGVAWATGFQDGQKLSREAMLAKVGEIVLATALPVSADLEGGYGFSNDDVAATVRGLIEVGGVGLNLEDSGNGGTPLLGEDVQVQRLQAAREAARQLGVDIFINARTDVYLLGVGAPPEERFQEAVKRGNAYLQAGADGVFIPGLSDLETIKKLVQELNGPLNVMVGARLPSVAALERVGVARVSSGQVLAQAAYMLTQHLAKEFLTKGVLEEFPELLDGGGFRVVNGIMR
jgi:2-methylisocitrate lyase-like PEP mutase family enzyme